MSSSIQPTPWFEVYNKLALALHRFYRKYGKSSGQELFKLLDKSQLYRNNNKWLSNIDRIETPSIEPIQLFVSFNRSGQKEEIRLAIINEIRRLLSPRMKPLNAIDFEGCPAPLAIKLQYVRPEAVQAQIWDAFSQVMESGKEALTPTLWSSIRAWRGLNIPSFTIFLFWINSNTFIALDKNTRKYLEAANFIEPGNRVLALTAYLSLLSDPRIPDHIKLSREAYYFNQGYNDFNERFKEGGLLQESNLYPTNFKLIGIRTLNRAKTYHKILLPNQYYPFDSTIRPKAESKSEPNIFLQNQVDRGNLYNIDNLQVNITAIVGKNGSGKSTLMDLVLMGLYNMSIKLGFLERSYLQHLNFELYWQADTLYKIVFLKGYVLLYKFTPQKIGDTIEYHLDNQPLAWDEQDGRLFYTILVNYSHYALNSSEQKQDWITPISHKNDGYATPVVINPQRTAGSININREKTLLNMRLLLNLLELHDADIPAQSFRYIDNGKYLKSFSITYDEAKTAAKKKEAKDQTYGDPKVIKVIIDEVYKAFGFGPRNIIYQEELELYIVGKLVNIIGQYKPYLERYKTGFDNILRYFVTSIDGEFDFQNGLAFETLIKNLVNDLKKDKSHVTLKLKQAIYYLKYPSLENTIIKAVKLKSRIDLDDYHKTINHLINSNDDDELTEGELLPPAIFKLDFHLDDEDESSFSKASSGEYQLVSVLSSILYHIRNIDSVNEGFTYNYVTVLLDEIELYFHPNMQRLFIKKLLDALSKLENDLFGIHILFATHSPFILSDIEQDKILKLKNGTIHPTTNTYNTFAANIHDLLADEFFLTEGYMGAFAKQKIERAIDQLNYITLNNEIKKIKEREHSDKELQILEVRAAWHKEKLNLQGDIDQSITKKEISKLIRIIGEPIIKENLTAMYQTAFSVDIEEEDTKTVVKTAILDLMQKHNIQLNELQ